MVKVLRLFILACVLLIPVPAQARETVNLSGEWDFHADPKEVGSSKAWYDANVPFDRRIAVPGAWNAQGVGEQSGKLFRDFPGPAWYRQTVMIPESWAGKVIQLKFGGVHRYADVWVNGRFVGSHVGYLTPFKFDISRYIRAGQTCTIAVRVDARQRKDVDPLIGCFDVIDAMHITWGGPYRGVELQATEHVWIEDAFVVPRIASRTAEVRIELEGVRAPSSPLMVTAEVLGANGVRAGYSEDVVSPGCSTLTLPVNVANLRLWSPRQPHLYTVKVRLLEGSRQIDSFTDRFGMREFNVQRGRFLLNGRPIFLRGYGDDCVYPLTIAPPADKAEYYRRFRIARDYGFNYVRHHSWFPLNEYFDVADELGIMLQPEFPIAYRPYYDAATPAGKKLYLEQWREIIKANRNHPSIVTWCVGNELYSGTDLSSEMYRTAKELDPTRLVIDSDGVSLPPPGEKPRETLDFLSCQFDEHGKFGFNDGKYDLGALSPEKPIVVHEMSNFATLPDLDQADLFHGGIRPFWLYQAAELAERKGITPEFPSWVGWSNRLQAIALKTNIEAARRSPQISGYHQWLLQDYWTGSNGVLDIFYGPKAFTAEEFGKFNSPTVLLMDCPRRSFRSGEVAGMTLLVSRYEDEPSERAILKWELRFGDLVINSGLKSGLRVASGRVQELLDLNLLMPALPFAAKLSLRVELADENGRAWNDWNFWVFPRERLKPGEHRIAVSGPKEVRDLHPWAKKVPRGSNVRKCDLLVTERFDAKVVEYLEHGGRVLLLSPEHVLPTTASSYKPCWWLGDPEHDSNVGTVIAPRHPALAGIPHDGWCDLQFYPLIQASRAVLLDDAPAAVRPIIRCLDVHASMRNKAYLFEVSVGKGKLLVSGLNFADALRAGDPAAEYLLDRLVRYTLGSDFKPRAALPAEYLRTAVSRMPTPPDTPMVSGFVRVLKSTNEPMEYPSHRDSSRGAEDK